MLGIIVLLLLSWMLLYMVDRSHLSAIGLIPDWNYLLQFLLGFGVSALLCILIQLSGIRLNSGEFVVNQQLSLHLMASAFWWDFRSVLTEELIFRGAVLYIMIRIVGSNRGIIISAISFGIYHWFSMGILGNLIPMIVIFLGTAMTGYAWALGFAKTGSVFLPFGFHFGWNLLHNTVFSRGPLGDLILVVQGANELPEWQSNLFSVSTLLLVPLIELAVVVFFIGDKNGIKKG